jgi:hypothetical protein
VELLFRILRAGQQTCLLTCTIGDSVQGLSCLALRVSRGLQRLGAGRGHLLLPPPDFEPITENQAGWRQASAAVSRGREHISGLTFVIAPGVQRRDSGTRCRHHRGPAIIVRNERANPSLLGTKRNMKEMMPERFS